MCGNTAIKKMALRLGVVLWLGGVLWIGAALWPGAACAAATKASPDAIVKQLMTRGLVGSPGKEVLMVTVE